MDKMKKIIAFIIISTMIGAIFCSCGSKNNTNSDGAKVIFTDNVDKSNVTPTVEMPKFLGDVTFTPDSEGAKKVVFKGKETVLQVTDASGLTWKLTIPGNALLKEETITMTPLKDVRDADGRELSGVLLEPDGLKFIAPATLTVTGRDEGKGWIYNADHRGRNPQLSLAEPVEGGIKSRIFHFSSLILDNKNPIRDPEKKKEIDRKIKELIPKVKEMLKESVKLPTPPEIELECIDDNKWKEALEYQKDVFDEEVGYISVLWMAYAAYKESGDPLAQEIKPLIDQMIKRVMMKIDAFFEKYSPQPERFFVAVTLFDNYASMVMLDAFEAVMEGHDDAFKKRGQEMMKRMVDWVEHTMKYIIEQIRTEHNYKLLAAAYPVYIIYTEFADIGNKGDLNGNKEIFEELRKALTFKVTFEGKVTDEDEDGTVTWKTEGEAIVQLEDRESESENLAPILNGEGVGMHTDYKATDPVVVQNLLTKDFPVKARVYLNPCKEQAAVLIDRLGASELTYDTDGQDTPGPSFFNWFGLYLKDNYIKKDSMLAVVVDFESGEAEFEQDLEGSIETTEISYTIKLVHSPQ